MLEEQATSFAGNPAAIGQSAVDSILFRDRDSQYARPFDEALRAAGVDVRKTPVRSPNLAAFIERWG